MIVKASVILVLLAFSSLSRSEPVAAEGKFYRVSTGGETMITSFGLDGVLEWSNSVSGTYVVEKACDLAKPEWSPHTRGIAHGDQVVLKVEHFEPVSDMVFIPGGRFTMGDILGDTRTGTPVHTVELNGFMVKRNEITNREFRNVCQWAYEQGLITVTNGEVVTAEGGIGLLGLEEFAVEIQFTDGVFSVLPGKENYPVVFVSWYGSVAFCNFLGMIEGRELCYDLANWTCDFSKRGYRLPTESEWEYAARSGFDGMRFPWGDANVITHSRANYRSSTNNIYDVSPTRGFHPDYVDQALHTSPVGVFAPSNYGLYDMAGNVWEWVWDWSARYPSGHQINPTGPASGVHKVFRGGSNYTTAERCTCATRYTSTVPTKYGYDTGFRTVLVVQPF